MTWRSKFTELSCNECGGHVQFMLDLTLFGNHLITCPKCGEKHCCVHTERKFKLGLNDYMNGPVFIVPPERTAWSEQPCADIYDYARQITFAAGFASWTDPRTGEAHRNPAVRARTPSTRPGK